MCGGKKLDNEAESSQAAEPYPAVSKMVEPSQDVECGSGGVVKEAVCNLFGGQAAGTEVDCEDIPLGGEAACHEDEKFGVTPREMTMNFINGGLGSGILSMPWGLAGAGLFNATLIIFFVLAANALTCSLLVYAGDRHQVFDLAALLRKLPGRWSPTMRWICEISIWGSMWGCLVGYMIVVADSITETMPIDSGIWRSRTLWVLVGSVLCFPLCAMDQKWLALTSTASILVNVYLFVTVSSDALTVGHVGEAPQSLCAFGMSVGSVSFFSNMMYSIVLQMTCLPMYRELTPRKPEIFAKVVTVAFSFLFLLFVAFASVGYVAYGPGVQSNFLKDMSKGVMGTVGRLGMLIVVLGVYPLVVFPRVAPLRVWEEEEALRAELDSQECKHLLSRDDESCSTLSRSAGKAALQRLSWAEWTRLRWRSLSLTAGIVSTVMFAALFITNLGYLNVINGAICSVVFVTVIPGVVAWYLMGRTDLKWRVAIFGAVTLSTIVSLLGLVYTDNYVDSLEKACAVKW